MPIGPMQAFLTRRSLVVLTGGLAFAVAYYWYIRRQRSMKCLTSEDKHKKVDEKCRQENSGVSKDSRPVAKKSVNVDVPIVKPDGNVPAMNLLSMKPSDNMSRMKPSDNMPRMKPSDKVPDVKPSDKVPDVKPSDKVSDEKPSDEMSDVGSSDDLRDAKMNAVVRVLEEVSNGGLPGSNNDSDESLYRNEKISTDSKEEPMESPLIWKELEADVQNMHAEQKEENGSYADSAGEPCSEMNVTGCRPVNTPSSEGSQDSGRATGGLASSLSPADDVQQQSSPEIRPMYEFEIPNSLVGLIIGIKGKTIKELCVRTNVRMVIRQHHTPRKLHTHQICTVEGPRENINRCLRMMRHRFPAERFPELNLRPVLPSPFPDPPQLYDVRPVQLTLPEGERCRVNCSAVVDVGHFFLQQTQNPSYSALQRLDYYMFGVYMQPAGVPDIPKPVEADKLCVAPAFGGWYRAVTLDYYPEEDEVLVKYVDYGGYSRLPRTDLRQIRTDFMTLPFQAVECYLAHVEPADGTATWSEGAMEMFQSLTEGRALECYVVGYHIDDSRPIVELFATDENKRVDRIDSALLDAGLAKASDPSKVRPVHPKPVTSSSVVTTSTSSSVEHRIPNEICAAE